ncbi:MAG: tRNA epoxyqueuosine(34) reductase QueG, partial [Gammaproteobacteria bacterium]|nr:tRNA epoxyqueuosine(34) reductase QueG [Gammaproteobacteria bacterium]
MSRPLEPFQNSLTMNQLAQDIKRWAAELGFQQTGITDTRLQEHVSYLEKWLARHFHGTMSFMQRNTELRAQPDKLLDSTLRVISVRMDYHPKNSEDSFRVLENPQLGYVSRYANGRDYHKLMRKRLQQLADRIRNHIGEFNYRAFVDSAPVLEKALAEKAGLGWIGKHTNLVNSKNGSWFFLGELYTNLPLPMDEPAVNHCGSC